MNMPTFIERSIYLDNAATSYPKPACVYTSLLPSLYKNGGNPGRSSHFLSKNSADGVFEVRQKIADMLCYDSPERVVFTQNATYALHLAIRGLIGEKKHILISDIEHNAVFREIASLKEMGYRFSVVPSGDLLERGLKNALTKETGLAVINAASNVSGTENDLSVLSDFRIKYGIPVVSDVSQLIGHKKIDLSKTPLDAVCAPGHKGLFGLMGSGFAVFGKERLPAPSVRGGSGSDSRSAEMPSILPDRLEAGTLPVPAIVSLGKGIDFVSSIGIEKAESRLRDYTQYVGECIRTLENIRVVGSVDHGVLSIVHKSIPSERFASVLEEYGVLSRAGLHCAPLAHRSLGTENAGTVRLSFSVLNTRNQCERLCRTLKKLDGSL